MCQNRFAGSLKRGDHESIVAESDGIGLGHGAIVRDLWHGIRGLPYRELGRVFVDPVARGMKLGIAL